MGDDIIIEYIKQRLEYMLFMAEAYWAHEVVWGVPCGPTLTMIYPTRPLGLDEFDKQRRLLTFKEAHWGNNENT